MSSPLEELFILIDWEDGKSLVCPISKIVKPKKDAGDYYIGERVLAKRPRLGNKYGVIAAIHDDRAWLKSLKSEVDTPRTAQNGPGLKLLNVRKLHDSSNEKKPVTTNKPAVLSSVLKPLGISSASSPDKHASELKSRIYFPKRPSGHTIISSLVDPPGQMVSSISPLENAAGQAVSSISPLDNPAGQTVLSISPLDNPTGQTVSGISPLDNPAGQTVSSISPLDNPAGQTVASISPLVDPAGQMVSSISPLDNPAGQTLSSISPLDNPAGQTVSGISPLDNPAGQTVSGISPLDNPAGQMVSSISPLDNPAGQMVSGISPLDNPAGQMVSSISPLDNPARQIVSTYSPLENPAGEMAASIYLSEKPAEQISEISCFLTPHRKRRDSSNLPSVSDDLPLKKSYAGVAAYQPINTLASFSESTAKNVNEAQQTFQSSCENSPTSLESAKLKSVSETLAESDVSRFVSMKEFKKLQKEVEDLKYQLRAMKQTYERVDGAATSEERKFNGYTHAELTNMVQFESDPYKAAWTLLNTIFTQEDLVMHTVSGKPPNSKIPAKPKFDRELYNVYCNVMREIFPGIEYRTLLEKTQSVQKTIQRQHKQAKGTRMHDNRMLQDILKAQNEFTAQAKVKTERSYRWRGRRFNGHTFEDLKGMVYYETEPYNAAWTLLNSLFTTDYLLEHSVSGKAPNSRTPAKPKIDKELYSVYCDILLDLFPGIQYSTITQKTHFVQSKLKMQGLTRQRRAKRSAKM